MEQCYLAAIISGQKYFIRANPFRLEGLRENGTAFDSREQAESILPLINQLQPIVLLQLELFDPEVYPKGITVCELNKYHYRKPFHANLRRLREQSRKTISEVARAIHLHQKAIYTHETGAARPSLDTLCAYAKYYGVTIENLVKGRLPEVIKGA